MKNKQIFIAIVILIIGLLVFGFMISYEGGQQEALNYSDITNNINAEN